MSRVGDQLRERRLDQARELAAALYQAGASRVWLFGSLARGDATDRRTDIDLAVEGLGARQCALLTRQLRDRVRCKVDLVRIEEAGPALRRSVGAGYPLRCSDAPGQPSSGAAPGTDARRPAGTRPIGLHQQRIQAVVDAVAASRLASVLDLGCGEGQLLVRLSEDRRIERLLGVDISSTSLAVAARRLGIDGDVRRTDAHSRIRLLRALATNPDPRFLGHEVVVAMEVLEHFDPPRLSAFRYVVFSFLRPALVVVTTPNADYNVHLGLISAAGRRIQDHRFEWTRDGFRAWMTRAAGDAGYRCAFREIGAAHPSSGSPTQMAVCTQVEERVRVTPSTTESR